MTRNLPQAWRNCNPAEFVRSTSSWKDIKPFKRCAWSPWIIAACGAGTWLAGKPVTMARGPNPAEADPRSWMPRPRETPGKGPAPGSPSQGVLHRSMDSPRGAQLIHDRFGGSYQLQRAGHLQCDPSWGPQDPERRPV